MSITLRSRGLAALLLGLLACDEPQRASVQIIPVDADTTGADLGGTGGDPDGAAPGGQPDVGGDPSPIDAEAPDRDAERPKDAGPGADVALDEGPGADAQPPLAQCENALDDDGDGPSDYPFDPGCDSPQDDDENDPDVAACGNGEDDDADGVTDEADPGCANPTDPNEGNVCTDTLAFRDVTGQRDVTGRTEGEGQLDAGCRSNEAPEAVHLVTLRRAYRTLRASTLGSTFDTVLSIRRDCGDVTSEVACNDDARPSERTSVIAYEDPAPGDYFVIVDGFRDAQGQYSLTLVAEVDDGEACPPPGGLEACRLGSICIDDTCTPAVCSNGRDDDGDGERDYPLDPGCETPADDDETDPPEPPQCANGQDDDFNGATDFPDDPSCESAADPTEEPPPDCRNGIDDDGDGLIDLEDPGCRGDPDWFFEFNTALCRDGVDNDADDRIDYPNDPGCTDFEDPLEDDAEVAPACANGEDDDGDGRIDFPAAARACIAASDPTEVDPCTDLEPEDITGVEDHRGNLQGDDVSNEFTASCALGTGREVPLLWRVAEERPLAGLQLSTRGSRATTILYVRDACDAAEDLGCDRRSGPNGSSFVDLGPQAPGTTLWIFVDSESGTAPDLFRLRATAKVALGGRCGDGDVWVCADGLTCEEGLCTAAACSNGVDDDADGLVDWPVDAGCNTQSDTDELDPALTPECANGLDDDGNGLTDYPLDPGCVARGDSTEIAACADGVDNDGDALLDYDQDGDGFLDRNGDPGCACNADASEGNDPVCFDGCDNDRDGLVDLADPGCDGTPQDGSEFNVPQCQDGIDNDRDGAIDFPFDDGCPAPTTGLETNPDPAPACNNGADDDGDGRIDYAGEAPDDGCGSAADTDEVGPCDRPQAELPANGRVQGNTNGLPDEHRPTCSPGSRAPEAVFAAFLPYRARVEVSTEDSTFDTVAYARSACVPERVCEAPPAEVDAGPGPADAGLDAAVPPVDDAALPVDAAAPPDGDDAGVPACMPGPTEVGCNDDGIGVQSQFEFDWPGGEFFVFVDGFGASSGAYALAVTATFAEGDVCGPGAPAWATCEAGTACGVDAADGQLRCLP